MVHFIKVLLIVLRKVKFMRKKCRTKINRLLQISLYKLYYLKFTKNLIYNLSITIRES